MSVAFLVVVGCAQVKTPTPSATSTTQTGAVTLTVSAAASLQDALKAITPIYEQQQPDVMITYNFGSSGALQQQIEQGAPIDVFISAAPKQMNALQNKNLLLADTRKNLLTNQVVLVTPKDVTGISDFKDLTGNKVSKVAMGNPDSVPAGQYGKEVFTSLKMSKSLESKFVFAKDVRQVLSYVETGNVDAGIVYATDAKASDKVKVVATAPANSHSPIIYPIAVLKDSKNPDAAKGFVEFLGSDPAKAMFTKYGFSMAGN
ncbi:MAG TPA: molybdate ABC transporter substrate-binding protein [Cyanobacteria bacterium UBA8803]|nr:molybdate ABC transporter substrate-binding protein [Cyanobacteria bacterium UBA9273]HBL57928.1 molybdate ABC transporter substrate-binding protein [Cyanobacteria bacterium UBA8803]